MPRGPRWSAIPFLSHGFRPFFLAAAIEAPAAMILWIGAMTGQTNLIAVYGAVSWHAHELLFGYVSAVIAGFLLTAVPNWTGRPPLRGLPLLGLFLLWLVGRVALWSTSESGLVLAITIDSLFLPVLALLVGSDIVAARNWRNLRVVALVAALGFANAAFHFEILHTGSPGVAMRLGLSIIMMLIMVIGGRITPSFTRNWLIAQRATHFPANFGPIDRIAVTAGAAALALWIAWPDHTLTSIAMLCCAGLHAIRVARWRGLATWPEPMLLVLHAGYAFVPIGFLTIGLSILNPSILTPSAALHAWTAGAIGVMTLGVMTRVSLGHTGRTPTASRTTSAIYVAVVLAAALRVSAPAFDAALMLLLASAFLWVLAFAGFVACYGPFLVKAHATGPSGC